MRRFFQWTLLMWCAQLSTAQTPTIEWNQTVVISDDPLVAAQKTSDTGRIAKAHRTYGAQYGRMIKLTNGHWLAAYTISRNTGYQNDPKGGYEIEVAISADDARHWKKIAVISDPGRDLDNAQLIQLADGTILLGARSVRWQESYRLPVYGSKNNGRTWKKISTIDSNEGKPGELGKPDKGMYEPHFLILDDGRLSVMYANEKHVTERPSYSQIISQKISPDNGKTWGEEIWVAHQSGHPESRPGMPVWTKMKNGKYIVVYEICGPEKCNIYSKTSDDGINWPVGFGNEVPDQHAAPYVLSASGGTLVLSSNKSNISVSDDYGATWQTVAPAFDESLWTSVFETRPNEIAVVNGVKREKGGHSLQVRFGKLTTNEKIGQISKPVLDVDFPDPTVIDVNGTYYAYATETGGRIIQIASSKDLKNWKIEGGALHQKPTWGNKHYWAPHVLYDSVMKKFVMFYSADSTDTSIGKCLGVALSDKPTGPFTDKGDPLICGEGFLNIDPMAFVDHKTGKKLLYWGSGFGPIKVQEMSDNWQSFKPGTVAKPVIWPKKEKDYTELVEGAWVDYYNGYYYMYFSGDNCCGDKAKYAVMVARSKDPFGPFETLGEANGTGKSVILEKDSSFLAPGHNSIIRDKSGNPWIAYHAIKPGSPKTVRVMYIDRIEYRNGWPVVIRKTSSSTH